MPPDCSVESRGWSAESSVLPHHASTGREKSPGLACFLSDFTSDGKKDSRKKHPALLHHSVFYQDFQIVKAPVRISSAGAFQFRMHAHAAHVRLLSVDKEAIRCKQDIPKPYAHLQLVREAQFQRIQHRVLTRPESRVFHAQMDLPAFPLHSRTSRCKAQALPGPARQPQSQSPLRHCPPDVVAHHVPRIQVCFRHADERHRAAESCAGIPPVSVQVAAVRTDQDPNVPSPELIFHFQLERHVTLLEMKSRII